MRIGRFIVTVLLLGLFLGPAPAAWAQKVEITPFVGLRLGGDFEDDGGDFFDPDFEVDESSSYGLNLGFALSRSFQIELFWSHQESELVSDEGFFLGDVPITDLDVDYLHAGVLYQWAPGQLRPFVTASLGITEFSPDNRQLEDETRFSASVGGGLKIFFNKTFGLRFEARVLTTVIDEDDDFCDREYRCRDYDDGSYFFQAEVRGGLIFAL